MKLHGQLNQPWHLSSLRYWGQNSLWAYRGTEATQYIDLYTIWIYSCKDLRWKSDIKFRLVLVLLRPKCVSLFLFFPHSSGLLPRCSPFLLELNSLPQSLISQKNKEKTNKQKKYDSIHVSFWNFIPWNLCLVSILIHICAHLSVYPLCLTLILCFQLIFLCILLVWCHDAALCPLPPVLSVILFDLNLCKLLSFQQRH